LLASLRCTRNFILYFLCNGYLLEFQIQSLFFEDFARNSYGYIYLKFEYLSRRIVIHLSRILRRDFDTNNSKKIICIEILRRYTFFHFIWDRLKNIFLYYYKIRCKSSKTERSVTRKSWKICVKLKERFD